LPNFSGQRSRSTVATVDGLNASEPSGSNLLSLTTSIDAIGEVKVLRYNYGGPMPLPHFGEGGPALTKGKAFFFFNLEKPHTITPTDPVFVTVPTALERIGNFSQSRNSSGAVPVVLDPSTGVQFPGNIIPSGRFNQSTQNLLNYFPLPNSPIASNPGRYVFQRSVDVPKHSYLVRFDVKPSNNDSIYFKAQWW